MLGHLHSWLKCTLCLRSAPGMSGFVSQCVRPGRRSLPNLNITLWTFYLMQSAVYLARAAKGGGGAGSRLRQLHAPARRLARTTISLGPEEGIMFGLRSIRWVNMNT